MKINYINIKIKCFPIVLISKNYTINPPLASMDT